MSIAIEPELHDTIKEYAKRKGVSASAYIGDLVEKAVKIDIDEEPVIFGKGTDEEIIPIKKPAGTDIMPVVLKIPAELKDNREQLTSWLASQCSALVKKLAP